MRPFTFNFASRKVVAIDGEPIDSAPLRAVLQAAVGKFARASIRNGRCAVYDAANGCTIVISGSSISKENFRTGSLVMRFALTPQGRLRGSMRLREHFYENGNSVADQVTQFDESVGVGSNDETAVNAVKRIGAFYAKWTIAMQKAFDLLANEGLDKLRRRLPITKTHINWQQEIIGAASMPVGGGKSESSPILPMWHAAACAFANVGSKLFALASANGLFFRTFSYDTGKALNLRET
jgi:hypothetical protein